jgi:DNA adenine methylase
MMTSPLRYPGGKSAMAGLLSHVRKLNGLRSLRVVEPFAGGAGASLKLLALEETPEIQINDVDRSIYDFWWSVKNRPKDFARMLDAAPVSIHEWQKQRAIYRSTKRMSRLQRGFATFYLNRCNRSGIIMNGGPIGGIDQEGPWKIDARFSKSGLLDRCRRIAEYGNRIALSMLDGIELIDTLPHSENFFFIDPPYYGKGQTLYMNALDKAYHLALSQRLRSLRDSPWVLTYDDCDEIRDLYSGWAQVRPFSLRYVAANRRVGRELLIVPKWMRMPDQSTATL